MKLIKFRVQNYKSIRDSGDCWLASDMTVLAGKNESGKTAILEALRDFDADVERFPESAFPLESQEKPEVGLGFKMDVDTLKEISTKTGLAFGKDEKDYMASHAVIIFKDWEGNYLLEAELADALDKGKNDSNNKLLQKIKSTATKIVKHAELSNIPLPDFDLEVEPLGKAISEYINKVGEALPSVQDEQKRQKVSELINEMGTDNGSIKNEDPSDKFIEELINHIPNFVYFSSFDDELPFEIELAQAKDNRAVLDFVKVAGIDLDQVTSSTSAQNQKNILNKHSAVISGNFKGFWKQDDIELSADVHGTKLLLGVKEKNRTDVFKPGQRSKGFQWFLSFYLRLKAEEDNQNIILIDEPGLYLHAKAQNDVLEVLQDISKESQLIFSTHSPYLIDADRLDRVRLMIKDKKGSHVENKIHKGADTETLTPIITAVGLDITHDFSIVGKHNVLLEGISDYYFFQAARELIGSTATKKLNFIPSVGAPKIPQLASLLIGWGLDFVAVLDHDKEGLAIAKELKEKLALADEKVILISDTVDQSVEDLFTRDDFNEFVLGEIKNTDQSTPNSKFVKEHQVDKVLLSKKFFENVKADKSKPSLSQNTISSFESVLGKIGNQLK